MNNDTPEAVLERHICATCRFWRPHFEESREPVGENYEEVGGYCARVEPQDWEERDEGSFPPWVHSYATCHKWERYYSLVPNGGKIVPNKGNDLTNDTLLNDGSSLVGRVAEAILNERELLDTPHDDARAAIREVADAVEEYWRAFIDDREASNWATEWLRSQLEE